MLFILNKSHEVVGSLNSNGDLSRITTYFDDAYVQDLGTGAETFTFSTMADTDQAQYLVAGNFIAFKDNGEFKLFNIIQIEESHEEVFTKTVYCEMAGVELINEIIRPMKVLNSSLRKFLTTILEGTEWQLGKMDASFTQIYDFDVTDYKSVYELIQEYAVGTYKAEISYRVEIENGRIIGKYIDCYAERGNAEGFRFAYGSNLTSVTRTVDMSNLATALIGVGKNNLTFKEVDVADKPLGQDFITNEKAYEQWNINGSHIFGIHKEDTESAQELLRLTRLALEERVNPQIKYEMSVELLGKEVEIGDTVNVIDHEFNPPLYLTARVNQLTRSKTDPSKDEVVLANFREVNSNITEDMRALASQLEGYVDSQFPIGGDKIQDGAIGKEQFSKTYHTEIVADAVYASLVETEELIADKATIGDLQATNATIENLKVNKADIDSLNALEIKVNTIDADKANISDLNATNATIGTLQANKADIVELNAVKGNINILQSEVAEIGHIKSDVAEIEHILAGNITADNIASGAITSDKIQTGAITAGSGIIADGAIGSAQISSLDANKINAGEIDTSKVKIKGENGFLFIENNTLYVVDNNRKIRCELGVIENNYNYGFVVRGADGQTIMLDHNGVHNAGITDGAIDNRKVSENANISGKKLDIDSVIRTINEDGSVTIQGTKVQVGNTTLDIKLSEQSNLITEHTQRLNTQQAEIATNINAIKLKVDSQTYMQDKQAQQSILNKHSSSISVLENQIVNKVENVDIQNALDEYGNVVDSKILEKTSKLEQTDNSIRLSVAENKEKLSETTNYIVNSQALFSIEGFESIGGSIERYVYPKTSIVEIPIPEPPEQEETPPVDIPTETPITPPTTEENTNTQPPATDIPSTPPTPITTSTKIHFINTGHTGDCILIQTDNGKSILVDSNYRQNAEVVVDYLKGVGVTSLDYMIVTHFHTDHAEGFPYIMDNIKVKGANAYYRLPDFSKLPSKEVGWKTEECWQSFRVKCNEKGVTRHENLTEKQRITLSDTSYLEFYNTQFANYSDYNSFSLVVLFVHGNKKYLLTGDINPTAQAQLVGKIGKVDMAKVPHHGYNSTINEAWVKELNPRCWVTTRTYGWENAYRDVGMLQVLGYPNYVQYTSGGHIVLTSTGNDFTLNTSTKFLFGSCWCKYNNDDNLWYWFKQGGTIAKNETVIIQGKKYRFNSNGICINPYNPE